MQVLLYLVIMVMGALIGSRGIISKKIDKNLGTLQNACLLFLLAVMGYKIGTNNDILSNFHRIGFEAFLISLLCITFSIIFVKVFFKLAGGSDDN